MCCMERLKVEGIGVLAVKHTSAEAALYAELVFDTIRLRIQAWLIKRLLSTYLDGNVVQQPVPSFRNENGPI